MKMTVLYSNPGSKLCLYYTQFSEGEAVLLLDCLCCAMC